MLKRLLLLSTLSLSMSAWAIGRGSRQSQELSTQGFANNLGDQRLTQVEANVRSDTEESHSAGFNQSTIESNSNTLLHGQIQSGDALAGTETVAGGLGKGLSQTQNETFSRENAKVGSSIDELTAFLDKFGSEKYIRSINGSASDGFQTKSGSFQKIRNEGDSSKKASGTDATAKYGSAVAGQLSAVRYAGNDNSVRNDAAATGENVRAAVRENLWLENGQIKNGGAAFSDSEGEQPASASSGSVALGGDGVISGNTRSVSKDDIAKARTYVATNRADENW